MRVTLDLPIGFPSSPLLRTEHAKWLCGHSHHGILPRNATCRFADELVNPHHRDERTPYLCLKCLNNIHSLWIPALIAKVISLHGEPFVATGAKDAIGALNSQNVIEQVGVLMVLHPMLEVSGLTLSILLPVL